MEIKSGEITVVTASYNSLKYLEETIESVVKQVKLPKEHLIIDDFSQDGSYELAQSLAEKYPFLRVVRHDCNKGFPAALNTGISMANTEYIAVLDSDDVALPNWLSELYALISTSNDICAVGCGGIKITEWGELTGTFHYDGRDDDRVLNGINPFSHPGTVWRKSTFLRYGLYSENMQGWEDTEIFTRVAPHCKLVHSNSNLIKYRIRPSSLSDKMKRFKPQLRKALKERYQTQLKGSSLEEANVIANITFQIIRDGLKANKSKALEGKYLYDIAEEFKNGDKQFKALFFYLRSGFQGYKISLVIKNIVRCLLPKFLVDFLKESKS